MTHHFTIFLAEKFGFGTTFYAKVAMFENFFEILAKFCTEC